MYSAEGPHVIALNDIDELKNNANKLFSEGKYGQAIIGYGFALKQLSDMSCPSLRTKENNKAIGMSTDTGAPKPEAVAAAYRDAGRRFGSELSKLAAVLYSNKAASHLKLEKYQKALVDANTASLIDPSNFKALFRIALSYKGMGRWYDCHVSVRAALKLLPTNEEALSLLEESEIKMKMGSMSAFEQSPASVLPAAAARETTKKSSFRFWKS